MKRAVTAASRVFGLIVLVLAAGCGGGDDRLSREEFVSEAEQVCDDFDQRVNEVDEPQNADDVERYVNEVRPVVEDGLNDLRGLQPPEEFEEQWDELMAANDAGLEALDDLAQAGANGDEARVQEIIEDASRRDEESDRIALELGLEKCTS
jgi:Tfp pilus assembly protein PilP